MRFLDNDVTEIAGARILGTTLWTDYALNVLLRRQAIGEMHKLMNDYTLDKRLSSTRGSRKIDTRTIRDRHIVQRNWLSKELAKPFDGPTIVVTHHAPSRRSLAGRDAGQVIAAAYASNLDGFIEDRKIDVWVHGHTHDSCDYRIGKTRVVANPYGYEEELNLDFRSDFILEV